MLRRFFPPLQWLPAYRRDTLRGDLSAGLTVGVMLIPQGMAYALIAGLPPIYGLYASLVPLVIYALLGTSRQLAVGPVAMVSLLVAAGVAPLAEGDPGQYVTLALLLAFMVGVIQLGLGLLRFGFLVNFLSHPVLTGFTAAAALIIGLSQLKHLLGIPLPRSNHIHEILWSAVQQVGAVQVPTLLIGLGGIVVLVGLKRWKKTAPGALVLVVLGTLVVSLGDLEAAGVAVVGEVPRGLPVPTLLSLDLGLMQALLPIALTIALVGFMESIAVAKVYAARNRYEVDANQELIGLGLANVAGSFFQAYPTTGGFSRTAVNAQAGANTTVASLISAGVIGLTLLLLTGLFHDLPNAVLAAIVLVAVAGLIDWKEIRFLWQVDRKDFALFLLTFVATLGLGIEEGILVGVVASVALVVYQSAKPHTAVMGRLPGTDTYRNVVRHPQAQMPPGVAVLRMDASLYFANAAHFQEVVRATVQDETLQAVVLDAYPINQIDATGVHALKRICEDLKAQGIDFYIAGAKGPVLDRLYRAGMRETVGNTCFYHTVHEAIVQRDEVRPSMLQNTRFVHLVPA